MADELTDAHIDEGLRSLAAPERRRILWYLQEHETATVTEIADLLAGWQAADTAAITGPDTHEQIEISLVHRHLPQLAEIGFVQYDATEGSVTAEQLPGWVADVLDTVFAASGEVALDIETPLDSQLDS